MPANSDDMMNVSTQNFKRINRVNPWLWDIFSSGLPADYDLETLRKVFLLNLMMMLGGFFLITLGVVEFILRDYLLGIVDLSFFLLLPCFFFYLRKTKNYKTVGLIGTAIVGFFYTFFIAYGGKGNTAYLWSFTYPLISVFLLGARRGVIFSLLLLIGACGIFALGSTVDFLVSYSVHVKIRFIPAYVTILSLAFAMEKTREIFRARLEAAKSEVEKTVRQLEAANQTIQESAEKYRTFFKTSRDCVYISSLDGRVLDVNDAAMAFFGYDNKEELYKLRIVEIYEKPEDREKYIKLLREKSFVQEYPLTLRKKDGSIIDVLVTTVSKKDEKGNIVAFQGTIRDITEQKQANEKLRESEKKYRQILESIEDDYYEVDLAGNLTFFNDSLCRMLRYSRKELMGLNNRRFMDAENARKVYRAFNQVYKTGAPYKAFDWELIKKDGSKCYIETSVSLIRDSKGQLKGFRGILRDVTERRKFEAEKRRLEFQLRQAEKMEAIGALAGGVAHDLNNVLSAITGYPDLLLLKLPEDSPLRKPILAMQASGYKAAAIVQDLLSLARRGVSDDEVLSLNTVVSEYLKSPEYEKMKSLYPDVSVETRLETGLLNTFGSRVHLMKVAMNLVSNAVEAIAQTGKISITTENRYVDRPMGGHENIPEGDYVTLTVADTGIGIASEDMKRIFEPFYTKKKMGTSGTGLGLSVVWGTVKDHNGYIDVKSTVGRGTTFTLYFPVTRKKRLREKADLSIMDYMGGGQTVLVVDDVKEQRDLASAILEILGYAVVTASSGEEAVAYLQAHGVDLMVLDMIMAPGMDGLDTYRQVLQCRPGQKAVITSGYSETHRVKEALKLGAGRYVRKPYTLEKIGLAVKEELDK